jgi:hypothetical protein
MSRIFYTVLVVTKVLNNIRDQDGVAEVWRALT